MQSLSKQLQPLLSGAVSFDQLPEHVQEATKIFIYFRASAIVDSGDPEQIKREIESIPDTVRDLVRNECRRIYKRRFL